MSFAPHPAYRDCGVAWLGPLPRGWSIKRVKHVTRSIEQGWSPQCDGFPVASTEEWGVLKVGCVNGGRFDPEENKALPAELTPIPELGISAGDVLISRANTRELVGGAVCVSADHPNLLLCDKLYRLRLNDTVCLPQWLAVYLRSDAARGQIELAASGASQSMVNIGQGTILDLPMPLPMRDEQSQVLAFLDRETGKIDALVAEQERLIALLKEKRQAVISQAITKGLDASAPMKDSGVAWIGQVPAHWEVKRLRLLAQVQTGIAKGKDVQGVETVRVPYLRVANVQDGFIDTDDVSEIEIAATDLGRYLLRPGDVLMNEGGDFDKLGRGQVWEGTIDPCIHQNHVFAVRPHSIEPEWLALVTSADCGRFFFMTRAKQSTNLASISSTNLLELPVPCAPPAERLTIIRFVHKAKAELDTLTTEAHRAIALLRERRAALISAAVTGKIDVRGLCLSVDEAA